MTPLPFYYDDLYLDHVPPAGHPERPDRLRSVVAHLKATGLWDSLDLLDPTPADTSTIASIHSPAHIERMREVAARGGGMVDEGDTHLSSRSYDAAVSAAGAVCGAVDTVLAGSRPAAFCLVRPPGHHAEAGRPMGFCLFNNVAVGARYAQDRHGVARVAILDFDVHHGNGTQHVFERDASVLYISLHQYPFYPGTGAAEEGGIGEGEGATLNVPLEGGSGEADYVSAFDREVVPALRRHAPGLLLLSAGFDAHREDPLADMRLTEDSFRMLTGRVAGIAPVVSVLEGGYNLEALARSVAEHLKVLAAW